MQPKEFYNKDAGSYDARHDNATVRHMRRLEAALIKKYVKGKTLDIGCGTGEHLKLASGTGIDISYEMLKEAHAKGFNSLANTRVEELPFKNESFDSIICMFTVLNLCNVKAATEEMHRVLKKNGKIIISVASIHDSLGKMKKNVRINNMRLAFHTFDKDEFVSLLTESGFMLKHFRGLFILQKPYWNWFRNFSLAEKIKLVFERFLGDSDKARMYFGVFEKV